MATYKTPGVYVEEITKFPPSVAQVETAIPAFIGYTEKAEKTVADDLLTLPTRISSILEYIAYFGSAQNEDSIAVQVTSNDKIVVENPTPSIYLMYYSMQMYFANGGGPCYIVSVGDYSTGIVSKTKLSEGLEILKKEDEPTLILFPDATNLSSASDFWAINNDALIQCNTLQDRFTIMDTYDDDESTAIDALRNGINLGKDYLKYGAAYFPFLRTILDYVYDDADVEVLNATSSLPQDRIENLSDTIDTTDLLSLLDDVVTAKDDVAAAVDDTAALALKPGIVATLQDIISYLENLKDTLEAIYDIGREETTDAGVISATDDLDVWISDNIEATLSALNTRLDKLVLDNTKAKMSNTLTTASTGVVDILTITADGPPAVSTLKTAIDDLDTSGVVFALDGAFDTLNGGVSAPESLDTLETTDNTLYNRIKDAISQAPITLPPSSAMAGIYARVDGNTGVWKAPANVGVNYVIEPTVNISHEEQADMNVTTTGKSVNAIRTFTGKGTLVWGARTLAGNDNEWRYISVRRFFNMVEESVNKASEQFVFEPNSANTWVRVRAMIENFLILQWKAGALVGAKANEAFYVRIGLGQTMTSEDILNGNMIIEIGMAVVRPAEFIILRFSHKMQEA